jgi:hypothetical protein
MAFFPINRQIARRGGYPMSKLRCVSLAAFLAVLGIATAAPAAVCLFDDDNATFYQFAKLKLPNKLGATAPLSGIAVITGIPVPFPVTGAVTRLGDDEWVIGFTRYGQTCSVVGTLDPVLTGTLSYDCNFNGTIDETVPVEAIDCPAL